MQERIQEIRRSQFVLTYGPGSILESTRGPRLIPSLEIGLGKLSGEQIFENFEIRDTRLSIAIMQLNSNTKTNFRFFQLPSNNELKLSKSDGIYFTYIFPASKICYGREKDHSPILFKKKECPICHSNKGVTPLRFVMACTNGHLDDIDWYYAVHKGKREKKCRSQYYLWKAGGSSLSSITIQCPSCKKSVTMEQIYNMDFMCSGRYPERESYNLSSYGPPYFPLRETRSCDKKMKVIQRQSSSLYISNTITLLTIPEYDKPITRVLQNPEIQTLIELIIELNEINKLKESEIVKSFENSLKKRNFPKTTISTLLHHISEKGFEDLVNIYHDLTNREKTFLDFIYDEYESLSLGHRNSSNFIMGKAKKVSFDDTRIYLPDFYISPIKKIRTVTAQLGYQRYPTTMSNTDSEPRLVHTWFESSISNDTWLVAYEGIGEGLFINFKNALNIQEKNNYQSWMSRFDSAHNLDSRWGKYTIHPLFVWLHTLSHSLIRALSLFSGYSSSSLRERVYLNNNQTKGGILIYTTSAGQDASMGGLINTINNFKEILYRAIDMIKICSNDPVCISETIKPDRINGAACYSCLLISETSCEHQNKFLDRHLLFGD